MAEVAIVVPTLGTRSNLLRACLESISNAGCTNVLVVGPIDQIKRMNELDGLYSQLIADPGSGLPDAINYAISQLPKEIELISWLGDDDLITEDSLLNSLDIFNNDGNVVATYGSCSYVDIAGKEIFRNKSGKWASKFMVFLPNLIPQPGSLISRRAFNQVSGVRSDFPLSFDFELFFNLRRFGKLKYIPRVQGCFRWHPDSLSVEQRRKAVRQTSQIRKAFLPKILKPISFFWEPLIISGTLIIGKLINRK